MQQPGRYVAYRMGPLTPKLKDEYEKCGRNQTGRIGHFEGVRAIIRQQRMNIIAGITLFIFERRFPFFLMVNGFILYDLKKTYIFYDKNGC